METTKQEPAGILRRHPWAVLAVGLLTGIMIPVYLISNRMSAKPMTEAEVSTVSPGGEIEATLEVTATPSEDLLQGTLLERQGDGTYQRSKRTLNVRWRSDTPVVMGKKADVHGGAVIQIKGKNRPDRSVDAERIVILTGYVTVR